MKKFLAAVTMLAMFGFMACKTEKKDEVPTEDASAVQTPSQEDAPQPTPAPEEPIDEQPLHHSPADSPVGGDAPMR